MDNSQGNGLKANEFPRRTSRKVSKVSCCCCTDCGDEKSTTAVKKRHHKILTGKAVGKNIYKCQTCDESYLTLESLNIHQITCSYKNLEANSTQLSMFVENTPAEIEENNAPNLEPNEIKIENIKTEETPKLESCNEILSSTKNDPDCFFDEDLVVSPESFVIPCYACCKCGATFTDKDYYESHIEKDSCFPVAPRTRFSTKRLEINGLQIQLPDAQLHETETYSSLFAEDHECYICRKTFKQKKGLVRHFNEKHQNALVYNCDICQKKMCSKRILDRHVKEVHADESQRVYFQCDICDKTFTYKKGLERHINEKHRNFPGVNCPICQKLIATKRNLDRHIKETHENSIMFDCHFCERTYSTKRGLNQHLSEIHKGVNREGSFQCHKCEKTFMHKSALERHIKETHDNSLGFNCHLCQKSYGAKRNYDRHVKEVHEISPTFNCHLCQKTYGSKRNFDRHIKEIHEISPTFNCHICQKTFTTKRSRDNHIKEIHDENRVAHFQCPICNKSFMYKTGVDRHIEETHENSSTFNCTICQKAFSSRRILKHHMQEIHGASLLFKCHICPKQYPYRRNLKYHMNTSHGNLLRHQCHICQKIFTVQKNLERHIKEIHKNENSPILFNCHICPKKYPYRRNLMYHIKTTHENNSVYNCPICQKIFTIEKNLNSHIKHMHGKPQSHKCNFCNSSFNKRSSLKFHVLELHSNVRRFQCNRCKFGTNQKYRYEEHAKICCGENRNSKCLDVSASIPNKMLNQMKKQIVKKKALEIKYEKKDPLVPLTKKTDKSSYCCTKCNFKTRFPSNLRRHMKSAHQMFRKKGLSGDESDKTSSIRISKCTKCNFKTRFPSNLRRHMKSAHQMFRKKGLSSDESDVNRILQKTGSIRISKSENINDTPIQIEEIGSHTPNQDKTDKLVDKNNGLKSIRIINCDEKLNFIKKEEQFVFKEPVFESNSFDNRVFVCSKCSDIFSKFSDYKKHIEEQSCSCIPLSKHPATTGKTINGLQIKLPSVFLERIHVDTILISPSNPKSTLKRNGNRKTKGHLTRHTKYIHGNRLSFKCTICQRKFLWKRNLDCHIKYIHGTRISFRCDLCNRNFHWKKNLDYHILQSHTNVRRFQCSNCNYGSNRKDVYEAHVKICCDKKAKSVDINSNVRSKRYEKSKEPIMKKRKEKLNLQCRICETVSSSMSTLIKHMKSHGEADLSGTSLMNGAISPDKSSKLQKTPEKVNGKKLDIKLGTDTGNIFEKDGKNEINQSLEIKDFQGEPIEIKNHFDSKNLYDSAKLESTAENSRCSRSKSKSSLSVNADKIHVSSLGESSHYKFSRSEEQSKEMRSALARALKIIDQKRSPEEDMTKYKCKLCFLTCLDASALEGHMKRH